MFILKDFEFEKKKPDISQHSVALQGYRQIKAENIKPYVSFHLLAIITAIALDRYCASI